jgi:hypothetical protein
VTACLSAVSPSRFCGCHELYSERISQVWLVKDVHDVHDIHPPNPHVVTLQSFRLASLCYVRAVPDFLVHLAGRIKQGCELVQPLLTLLSLGRTWQGLKNLSAVTLHWLTLHGLPSQFSALSALTSLEVYYRAFDVHWFPATLSRWGR